jgi:hypothetical protein
MEGCKTVKILRFCEDCPVPVVQPLCDSLPVCIIGISHGADSEIPQMGQTLAPVKPVNDLPSVRLNELPPDRFEQFVREEVDVKVNNRLWLGFCCR